MVQVYWLDATIGCPGGGLQRVLSDEATLTVAEVKVLTRNRVLALRLLCDLIMISPGPGTTLSIHGRTKEAGEMRHARDGAKNARSPARGFHACLHPDDHHLHVTN